MAACSCSARLYKARPLDPIAMAGQGSERAQGPAGVLSGSGRSSPRRGTSCGIARASIPAEIMHAHMIMATCTPRDDHGVHVLSGGYSGYSCG